jgi:mRNA interferase RelE/StbE
MLAILDTPTFRKAVKKLSPRDKNSIDDAIVAIANAPYLGQEKKGDLAGIFVHKFKMNSQEVLLAYKMEPNKTAPHTLILLSLGSHENFYRALTQ